MKGAVHFIAIGGIGMSALAKILLEMGCRVTGSDVRDSKIIADLRRAGAEIAIEHRAENIPPDCAEVVYSSAIRKDNPEMLAAQALKIPITHRGRLLSRLFNGKNGIAVAGSHGKTTTSAMLAQILVEAGKDPNIVLGGILPLIGSNSQKGKSDIWVVEADESDGSFLLLEPAHTIITNIEPEHMEHYGSIPQLERAFADFVKKSGEAIVCLDNPLAAVVAEKSECRTYALDAPVADLKAKYITFSGLSSESSVYFKGEKVARMHLNVPGRHNVSNALAALYGAYLYGVPFEEGVVYLEHFRGAGRRFEILYQNNDMIIVDDYAHHPTEVEETIKAAKGCGFKRVIAVFQPHRYSRVRDLYDVFGKSFAVADEVIIDEIYSAWEDPCEGITSQMIVDQIRKNGGNPLYLPGKDRIVAHVREMLSPGDLVLMMGAGDIRKTAEALCDSLEGKG